MFTPGNYCAHRCVFATIWACLAAIPTHLNCWSRSLKVKNATNKRFNCVGAGAIDDAETTTGLCYPAVTGADFRQNG